jgi:hypothetical protein
VLPISVPLSPLNLSFPGGGGERTCGGGDIIKDKKKLLSRTKKRKNIDCFVLGENQMLKYDMFIE